MTTLATSSARQRPPGPRQYSPLGSMLQVRRDARGFAEEMRTCYGESVACRFLLQPATLLFHPHAVQQVLQKNHQSYDKDVMIIRASRVLIGNGIFTSNGSLWLRQRRLMQPAFRHQHISAFTHLMTQTTQALLDRWQCIPEQQVMDIQPAMLDLSLSIIVQALLGAHLDPRQLLGFRERVSTLLPLVADYMKFPFPPLAVPTRRNSHLRRAIADLDAFLEPLIAQRRRSVGDQQDTLLSFLVAAQDEETGQGMSDRQLRDEVMTLILGGYETTGESMAWIFYTLAHYPELEARLHAELDQVLAGRVPTSADLPKLRYTRAFIDEVLRFYPPAVALVRHCLQEDVVTGYRIPQDSLVFLFPHITHRHPDFWEHPEQFDPERFLAQVAPSSRGAYFPFGAGPRQCIGNTFALVEMQLVVAMIAQRFQLKLASDAHISSEALVSVRLNALPMTLCPRL